MGSIWKTLTAERAVYDDIVASKGSISKGLIGGKEVHPLAGVEAAVETGSTVTQRLSATRMVALGVFSLAAPKKSGGESWLRVVGPDFEWVVKVPRTRVEQAQKFAAQVNTMVKKVQ